MPIIITQTDTIFGILGSAHHEHEVESIYALKKRDYDKPCIILINAISDISHFGISLSIAQIAFLQTYWPGPLSVILELEDNHMIQKFSYLHRGSKTLSFRIPDNVHIQNILKTYGPMIAPSANIQGHAPVTNLDEARDIFGTSVDIYLPYHSPTYSPTHTSSTLITLNREAVITILRQGELHI